MSSIQPGDSLGPYQIISQVGRGGMATIYKAFHAATNRYVAVKVLPEQLSEDPQFIERFRQEAQTIANLQHPRILPVFDYGENQQRMYMVMRYLDTGTLQDRMRGRALSLQEIDKFLEQLCDALGYAHANHVVHRDIKPSNMLVDAQGNIFLTDFGIAKLLERSNKFTATGTMTGTPDYMSPEQAQGHTVDQRTDIYSLGIILYEMLTGRVPFEAETPLAVILKHISAPLPPPSTLKPGLSPDLEKVVLKALAKDPDDRFATCADFFRAWREALAAAERVSTVPPQVTVAPARPEAVSASASSASLPAATPAPAAGRNDTWLIVGCVGLLALVLCVVFAGGGTWALALLNGRPSGPAPTRTRAASTAEPTAVVAVATRAPVATERPPATEAEATPEPSDPTATRRPPATPTPEAPPVDVVNVSENGGESQYPQVVVDDDGIVRVLWQDTAVRSDGDVLYREFADGAWSAVQDLTEGQRSPVNGTVRWLRNPLGAWCALWAGGLDWQMQCREGDGWAASQAVRTEVSWADEPNFAFAPDGSLRIGYVDFSVVMLDDTQVGDGQNIIDSLKMVLDAAGNPHLVWIESAGDDYLVKGRYSPDGGTTWDDIEPLSDADTHAFLGSAIDLAADAAGNVHLAWIGSPFGSAGGATFYRRWSPGEGWGETARLRGGQPLTELSLAVDADGRASLAGVGLVGGDRGVMLFRQAPDGAWGTARLIKEDRGSAAQSRYPSLSIDPLGQAHLAWQSSAVPPEIEYAVVTE
jgi:hypothetical protein